MSIRLHALLAALTFSILFVHGYHPFAEDGGLYVTGIEYRLNPSLFPHDTAFVTAHLEYSVFSPVIATLVRVSHLPLTSVLLVVYLGSIWVTLYAAFRIARQSFLSMRAALFATALLAATFTVPVAGTSLMLMDPYVTARTVSTPLALLSISFFLSRGERSRSRSSLCAAASLAVAAAFHPLMGCYAAAFLVASRIAQVQNAHHRFWGWAAFTAAATVMATAVQVLSPPESPASVAADISRYYWFPSQWQWFELLGLAGPCLVLGLALRSCVRRQWHCAAALCRSAIGLGAIVSLTAVLFAQQHFQSHAVARLQPLRAFLVIYAVMVLVLGGILADFMAARRLRMLRFAPATMLLIVSALMFYAQRQIYPASQHLELPGRPPVNPWSKAFLWARENTPADALFALDADYITKSGEDSQVFRATAQRSMLADFSKDGGEAAITPSLAATWLTQSTAQKDLSLLDDQTRDARMRPFGVTWMVLRSSARTLHVCPYDNLVVKICSSSQPPRQEQLRP